MSLHRPSYKMNFEKNRTSRPENENVEVIHFHLKTKGVQGLVFVQITFELQNWYKTKNSPY